MEDEVPAVSKMEVQNDQQTIQDSSERVIFDQDILQISTNISDAKGDPNQKGETMPEENQDSKESSREEKSTLTASSSTSSLNSNEILQIEAISSKFSTQDDTSSLQESSDDILNSKIEKNDIPLDEKNETYEEVLKSIENGETKLNFDYSSAANEVPKNSEEPFPVNFNETIENIMKSPAESDKNETIPVKDAGLNQNFPRKPTLVDDSKLVKIAIPLPANPMNLMQSNAQFLNKSRNFLNYITEKSTNIMEKTLLPQHIASKYNSMMKPIENKVEIDSKGFVDIDKIPSLSKNSKSLPNSPSFEIKDSFVRNIDTNSHLDVCMEENEGVEISMEGDNEIDSVPQDVRNDPMYLNLLRDYAALKKDKVELSAKVEFLEDKCKLLESGKNHEAFKNQMESFESTINRLHLELRAAKESEEALRKEYSVANKERESMVMKYASSEKRLIDSQRARDTAERKLKEITKDHEFLQSKLRQVQGERTRIGTILDTKCKDVVEFQREIERLKEEVNVRDAKLKWTQNKLKTEMDSQKDTQQKLDKALMRINEMKEECELVKRETQETMRQFQQSEENKAVTLDQQLKEQQARLILERHVTEDKEMLRIQLQKEVDLLKNRQQVLIEENNTLSLKIQDLEKDRLNYESTVSSLKVVADQRQKEILDLSSKVSQLETIKLQLQHKEQCLASNGAEIERLRLSNEELQADMDSCRQREAHMLDFTQKLTDKNVRLQSEFTAIEARAKELELKQGPLLEKINDLIGKVKTLESNLAAEKEKRIEECEILAKHIAEKTQLVNTLTQKLEDSEGEIAVLKRRQQISVKEMTRELQQCRKRLEAYETASPSSSLDPTSRTASNSSLNAGDASNGALSDNSANGENILHLTEPDRQTLIDRIIKLQKINVRRAEKLDFLEEHSRTLVEELQKKTKIIQNYILHENFDAMGSNERDKYKAELARHGGIMASVYNQRVSDDHMTLELSLEINRKLQSVLEDALLKNITLKDNIDTLGEEIARLTMQNQKQISK